MLIALGLTVLLRKIGSLLSLLEPVLWAEAVELSGIQKGAVSSISKDLFILPVDGDLVLPGIVLIGQPKTLNRLRQKIPAF